MKKLSLVFVALVLAACSGKTPSGEVVPPPEREEGVSEFLTPSQGAGSQFAGGAERAGDANAGAPAGPAAPTAAAAPSTPERLIEESDIYKIVGSTMYVLNRYRGLQVIDLTDLDRPRVIGRAPIFGWPKDMYVRGSNAYVIVSDYYSYYRDALVAEAMPRPFYGSQIRVVSIADSRQPRVIGSIDIPGDANDSRIVGDILYVASSHVSWWYNAGSSDTVDKTTVRSISIADPANVHVVDTKDFPKSGWEHHIMVTPKVMYLASSGYTDGRWGSGFETRIKYVDISDPAGQIRIRGEAQLAGQVRDRWSMDEHEGVLRVASGQQWGNGDVYLTTFDVTNPDAIAQLGQYTLHVNENLTAARFDGPNGYLVSYRNIDPLFAFDLSNPRAPRLVGELEMTGWLDFIVPMGDRLVALGHEDLTDPQGNRTIKLAVSLIAISPLRAPELLSRQTVGDSWGSIPAERDDFAKVFRVLGDLNLIIFPFHSWSRNEYRYIGGVQLIDFDRSQLAKRGFIDNAGWVERGVPHGPSTVLTLSNEKFQVMDIADRDRPRLRGGLELARNVQDFATLPGDHAVQLAGDWYMGDTSLTVTPLTDPDTPTPSAQVHVPAPYGRLFMNGSMAYLASREELRDASQNVTGYTTKIQVWDLTNPLEPRARGTVRLPEEVWLGYRYWYWGSGDEVVQVNGSTLAFHRFRYYYAYDCFDCGRPAGGGGTADQAQKLFFVDLSNPDSPRVASTVVLDTANWAWGLKASGTKLYLSEYQTVQRNSRYYQRYFLRRIDVSDPAHPVVLPGVNIPGMFIDTSPDGRYAYTLETWWDQTANVQRNMIHAVALLGDRAYWRSGVELRGYVNNVQVKGTAAFTTTQWWEQPVAGTSGGTNHVSLVAVDLADPRALRIAGQTEIPHDYAYLQKVEGGRAFIGSGAGIFSYRVDDIARLRFEEFFRTQGWSNDIVVRGDLAFVPSGYYGVQVLRLGTGQGS